MAWGHGGLILGLLLLVEGAGAVFTQAQDRSGADRDAPNIVQRYRLARYQLLAQKMASEGSIRTLPPEPIPTAVDSLFAPSSSPETNRPVAAKKSSLPVADVRPVRHLERSWFRAQYDDTEWAFLGARSRPTFLDTTYTRNLRARLQERFGAPTYTLAEVNLDAWWQTPDSSRKTLPQFAYWFVVNDSIPVRVTDVDGPTGRGLIVSTDRQHRDHLAELRSALLGPLRRAGRAPYVDYYYDEATRRWYRVGFDGQSFFRERISRVDIVPGRRPRLDTSRTDAPPPGTP